VIRGRIVPFFDVYEGNDSGRATFSWKQGARYLLFLSYSRQNQAWELDGCGDSGPLPNSTDALREIDLIHAHPGTGFIHGEINPRNSSDDGAAAGVALEALGRNGVFKALTNHKGQFVIKVPPGRYRLRASKSGWSFATSEFSYENPSRLLIEPGGCVQVEFYGYLER
jgi:hypothetical protein